MMPLLESLEMPLVMGRDDLLAIAPQSSREAVTRAFLEGVISPDPAHGAGPDEFEHPRGEKVPFHRL